MPAPLRGLSRWRPRRLPRSVHGLSGPPAAASPRPASRPLETSSDAGRFSARPSAFRASSIIFLRAAALATLSASARSAAVSLSASAFAAAAASSAVAFSARAAAAALRRASSSSRDFRCSSGESAGLPSRRYDVGDAAAGRDVGDAAAGRGGSFNPDASRRGAGAEAGAFAAAGGGRGGSLRPDASRRGAGAGAGAGARGCGVSRGARGGFSFSRRGVAAGAAFKPAARADGAGGAGSEGRSSAACEYGQSLPRRQSLLTQNWHAVSPLGLRSRLGLGFVDGAAGGRVVASASSSAPPAGAAADFGENAGAAARGLGGRFSRGARGVDDDASLPPARGRGSLPADALLPARGRGLSAEAALSERGRGAAPVAACAGRRGPPSGVEQFEGNPASRLDERPGDDAAPPRPGDGPSRGRVAATPRRDGRRRRRRLDGDAAFDRHRDSSPRKCPRRSRGRPPRRVYGTSFDAESPP